MAVIAENKDYIDCKDDVEEKQKFDEFHYVRREIWQSLLGWQPESYYGGITYAGFEEINSNRSECHYLLKFFVEAEISPEDTRQALDLSKLSELEENIWRTSGYGS